MYAKQFVEYSKLIVKLAWSALTLPFCLAWSGDTNPMKGASGTCGVVCPCAAWPLRWQIESMPLLQSTGTDAEISVEERTN